MIYILFAIIAYNISIKRGQDGIKLSSGVTLLLNGSEILVKVDRDSKDSLSIPVIKSRRHWKYSGV